VTLVPEAQKVDIFLMMRGGEDDSLVPVSRPAHRGFGLYRGGWSTWLCPFVSSLLSVLQKKCSESEHTVAIVHDDDLQLIENVVRPRRKFSFYARLLPVT